MTPTIAGIAIPDSALAREATECSNDILGAGFDTLTPEQREPVLAAHPRPGFKTGTIEALSAGVRHKPETATATMLADVLDATVPGYVRPNVCELIQNSPFMT